MNWTTGFPETGLYTAIPKTKTSATGRTEKKFGNGSVLKVGEEIYTTYEYETRGDFLIQKIFEPNHNRYVKPPGPCDGGDKYTTIYYRKR